MPDATIWRCLLGHRWEWIDSHAYELGRGYETALVFEECARCGALRQCEDSPLLPATPRLPRGGRGVDRAAPPKQED